MRLILIIILLFNFSNLFAQKDYMSVHQAGAKTTYSDNMNSSDSSLFQMNKSPKNKHSILNLCLQPVVGSGFAVIFSFLPLGATFANAWGNDRTTVSQTAWGILTISAYLFGSATGVYLVAKYENPELSLWETFGYSAIGGGVSALTFAILASQYKTLPGIAAVAAFFPVISSMIYASFISDWPQENQKISFDKKYIFHKDLIEQSEIIHIEILRIRI